MFFNPFLLNQIIDDQNQVFPAWILNFFLRRLQLSRSCSFGRYFFSEKWKEKYINRISTTISKTLVDGNFFDEQKLVCSEFSWSLSFFLLKKMGLSDFLGALHIQTRRFFIHSFEVVQKQSDYLNLVFQNTVVDRIFCINIRLFELLLFVFRPFCLTH